MFLKKWSIEILIFCIGLVYFFSGATTVTGEDSGSFHQALLFFGVNHPPGYPLYTLLGGIFVHLLGLFKITTLPHLVNLFSALWALVSLYILNRVLIQLKFSLISRAFALLIAAFSLGFWSQANVAEVYTMNVGLSLFAIYLWLRYEENSDQNLYLFSFVAGLALSHHYPLFILSVFPFVVLRLYKQPKLLNIRSLAKNLGFLFLGLTPYLFLFYRTYIDSGTYIFGNLYDLADIFSHISRKQYSVVDDQGASFKDKLQYLKFLGELFFDNFLLFIALIPMGILSFYKNRKTLFWPFLLAVLGPSLILIFLLNFQANELFFAVYRVYPIPAFVLLSVFFAAAIDSYKKIPMIIISSIGVLCLIYFNYPKASRYNDESIEVTASSYLESLPQNSRLILCGDEGISIYFAQKILNVRPDIDLISDQNSYTQTKILSRDEYKASLDSMGKAVRYRNSRINEWAREDRFLFSMCPNVFPPQKSSPRLFGWQAIQDHLNYQRPSNFDAKYTTVEFLSRAVPSFPKDDHWLYSNVLNYLPSYFALAAKLGKSPLDLYIQFIQSPRGKERKKILSETPFQLPRKIAIKLMELGHKNESLDFYRYMLLNEWHKDWSKSEGIAFCRLVINQMASANEMQYCEKLSRQL